MGRHKEVTSSEEKRIKELFSVHGKFRTVAAIVNRDPLTVKKILGVVPKKERAIEGFFNWSDFKSII